jgi:hypothetical protein
VGHSHGGNVALMALKDEEIRSRVAGVACLSTPFIQATLRIDPLQQLYFQLAALLGVGTVVIFFALENVGAISWILTTAILALVAHSQAYAKKSLPMLALPNLTGLNILLIRTSGDEAAGSLAAAYFARWLLRKLSSYLYHLWPALLFPRAWDRHLFFIASSIAALAVWHYAVTLQPMSLKQWLENATSSLIAPDTTQQVILVLFLAVAAGWLCFTAAGLLGTFVCACFLALGAIHAVAIAPYGWDLAFASGFLSVTVEPTPPGEWVLHQISSEQRYDWHMAHSSYDYPDVIALLDVWIGSLPSRAESVGDAP